MAKNPKDADDTNFAEESYYLEKKIQVLQHRLMMKDEQISGCRQAEESLHKRVRDLDRCFKDEYERSKENTGDMSRQYHDMQESFNERIEVLQEHVAEAKQEIEAVNREIERVRVEKDEVIRQKDLEIKLLSQKMESMAFEFADMLKETLDKMSQRVEVTHNSWDRDSGRPPLMNRLKSFSLTADNPQLDDKR